MVILAGISHEIDRLLHRDLLRLAKAQHGFYRFVRFPLEEVSRNLLPSRIFRDLFGALHSLAKAMRLLSANSLA